MNAPDLQRLVATLDGIGTRDCKKWRNQIFEKHQDLAFYLVPAYRRIAAVDGHVAANSWLRETKPRLRIGQTALSLDSDEEDLKEYALKLARFLSSEILPRLNRDNPLDIVAGIQTWVERTDVLPLASRSLPAKKAEAALKRYCDEVWWFKRLRSGQRRAKEALIRELGYVHKRRDMYVSELTFRRRLAQKARNRQLLESLEARNEEGVSFTLAELQDMSPANPIIRRAEMMVRIRGFEELAKKSSGGYQALFFTLTSPSKYHATDSHGRRNPKFCGATPLEAHDALNEVWARTRAAWDRVDIRAFGMRVVEPHHDGTPHWHLLLFVPRDRANDAEKIFQGYALEEDGDEPGALQHRLKVERIDPSKGSATGYIAKYVAKNIDGAGLESDSYGYDAFVSACRIEAWASTWGIRQFQQIGGPPVTVWRELRRLAPQADQDDQFEAARHAADESDWAEFTALMGGAACTREERPIRPWMVAGTSLNKYGEVVKSLKGVLYRASAIVTRVHSWVISTIPIAQRLLRNTSFKNQSVDPIGRKGPIDIADRGKGSQSRRPIFDSGPIGVASLEYCQ